MRKTLYVMVPTLSVYLNEDTYVNGSKAKLTHHD